MTGKKSSALKPQKKSQKLKEKSKGKIVLLFKEIVYISSTQGTHAKLEGLKNKSNQN